VQGHADLRGRIGGLTRRGAPPEKIEQARADLAAETMAAWIKRKLAAAPPLTESQLARIRAALPPAGGDHAT
jgi:hypothetical protein